jgi:hypothetical protein
MLQEVGLFWKFPSVWKPGSSSYPVLGRNCSCSRGLSCHRSQGKMLQDFPPTAAQHGVRPPCCACAAAIAHSHSRASAPGAGTRGNSGGEVGEEQEVVGSCKCIKTRIHKWQKTQGNLFKAFEINAQPNRVGLKVCKKEGSLKRCRETSSSDWVLAKAVSILSALPVGYAFQ